MRIFLPVLMASMLAASPCLAQEDGDKKDQDPKKTRRLSIPIPPDLELDDETLAAIEKGFEEEKARFLKGLIELHAQRIDYTRDDPRRILEKQRAARTALQQRAVARAAENIDRAAVMLNVVQIRNATAPRLSGRVLTVGEGEKYANLEEALAKVRSGDQIALAAGRHEWPRLRRRVALPADVAITGRKRDSVLVFQTRPIAGGKRLRLSGLTLEYPGRPFFQARTDSSLEIIDCAVNNTAGRGYGLYGSDAIVYVEGCVFNGDSEGTRPRPSASVFRLYRDSLLYVRRSRFLNHRRSIGIGQTGTVFEEVAVEGENAADAARQLAGRFVFTRGNTTADEAELEAPGATAFERATDHPDLIAAAGGGGGIELDAESERLIVVLGLERNLGYWIGLLLHPDVELRTLAAERVASLTGQEVRITARHRAAQSERVKALIKQLDSAVFDEREEASAALKKLGEGAREALEETRKSGTLEQQARADAILSELDAARIPAHEVEWGRLLRWFEQRRDELIWDKDAGRYRLESD